MIIDTHSHIQVSQFDGDRKEVIERALAAGVSKQVVVGFDLKTIEGSLMLSENYDFLYSTLGLHPYDADKYSEELFEKWRELIKGNKKIVALGETGLDYLKSPLSAEVQKFSFEKHLELAREVGLPVVVHNRKANEDCLELVRSYADVQVVYHCFDAGLDYAKKVWELGCVTSFTGMATYPARSDLREVIEEMPLDQFFVETDCPYLAPQAYRGKRNEPSFIVEIVKLIGKIRGLSLEEVAGLSSRNAERVFKI